MLIAVTGASGFIGTEVLARLLSRGHTAIALTRGGSAPAGSPYYDSPDIFWRQTDYSTQSLKRAIRGTDAVIHLAGVRGTTSDPDDYIANERLTEAVLVAVDSEAVDRIVFASTISVYDDTDTIPWKTDEPLHGRTAYGDSKIRCERMIRSWAEEGSDMHSYAIARIAQVLGLGERRRGMMNVFLDMAAAGGEICVIGKSQAVRQYIYVKDLAEIIVRLAEMKDSLVVNAGMPEAYTNLEIAKIVNKVYANTTPINYDDSQPETIKSSYMDIRGLKDAVGMIPIDMEQAIEDIKSRLSDQA